MEYQFLKPFYFKQIDKLLPEEKQTVFRVYYVVWGVVKINECFIASVIAEGSSYEEAAEKAWKILSAKLDNNVLPTNVQPLRDDSPLIDVTVYAVAPATVVPEPYQEFLQKGWT